MKIFLSINYAIDNIGNMLSDMLMTLFVIEVTLLHFLY